MLAAKRAICINCALHFVLHANKMHYGICNYVRVPLIKIVIVEKSCENGKLQVFLAARSPSTRKCHPLYPTTNSLLCNEVQLIYL